jgi:hypothetical protein
LKNISRTGNAVTQNESLIIHLTSRWERTFWELGEGSCTRQLFPRTSSAFSSTLLSLVLSGTSSFSPTFTGFVLLFAYFLLMSYFI